MKTTLVFSPFTLSNISSPYLSIPLLYGYLIKKEITDIEVKDINLDFISKVLEDKNIIENYT
ncbi:hypothetical protein KA977_14710, partial [Candidatus Dependentiae bacterium]|nr:hypothetical protein [Candidatus Dependentiae bacterium]